MRSSALLFAAAGLALVGCKSSLSAPAGQALASCGSNQVLMGPSTAWTCKPASSLDFGSALSADTSPDAGEAQFIAHADQVAIADQAASIAASNQIVLQDGTFPYPLPDGGQLDFPGGAIFDVFGGPVLAFGNGHVTSEVIDAHQQGPISVSLPGTPATFVSAPFGWIRTVHVGLRGWGTVTGDGRPTQPATCHVYLAITNSGAVDNWSAQVADQIVPGFSDGGVSGYSQWVLEGDVTLDAGTYQFSANLEVDGAGTCSAPYPPSLPTPAELTVEEL